MAKSSTSSQQFATMPHIDPKNKEHRDYWLRRWGISIHRLQSAFRVTKSAEVKKIEKYLRDNGAI